MEFSGRVVVRPIQAGAWKKMGASPAAATQHIAAARAAIQQDVVGYVRETDEYILDVPNGTSDKNYMFALWLSGNYEYVTPDWIVYPMDTIPNDTMFASLWGHTKCETPKAWDLFTGSNAVTVAGCDTGVRLTHEEMVGHLVNGFNAVNDLAQVNGGQVNDLNGHGTHTAGTMGAMGNNARGIAGIGWNFGVMPIRVSNSAGGSAFMSDLTQGARWGADNGARAVNVSYSGVNDPSVQTTGNYMKTTRNSLLCWAAGNAGSNLGTWDWADVIIVGATTQADARASFSNFGTPIDVVAPGVTIRSSYFNADNGYADSDGTSMATPFVTGMCALLMAANGDLTAQQIETIIFATCADLGAAGNDTTFGWGRVNVYQALRNLYNNYWFWVKGYTKLVGEAVSGGLAQAQKSDDSYLVVNTQPDSAGRPLPIELEFSAVSTNKVVSQISFDCELRASITSLLLRTYMFDYVANAYVLVDTRIAPTVDTHVTVTPASPARFRQVGTGNMKTKVILGPHSTGGQPFWRIFVDEVRWQTKAP